MIFSYGTRERILIKRSSGPHARRDSRRDEIPKPELREKRKP
jgi:hypothetical protein